MTLDILEGEDQVMASRRFTILFTLLGVAFVVSVVGFGLLYFLVGRAPSVPSNATLVLKVGGTLAEVAPGDVVGFIRGVRSPTVRSVVDALHRAKTDPRIRALIVKPTGFDSPFWAKVQEIRDAVMDFKKSGKVVYAYVENGGDREYYLASAADKVYLMPSASLDLTGVATYEMFLRGALDKVGAYPDLHHIGDYKTYSNTFTEKGYTRAHREMDESLNRDLYDQIVNTIARARKKSEAEVRALIDEGPFLPEDALKAGLVDDVQYEDQVDAKLHVEGQSRDIDWEDYARSGGTTLGLSRGPRLAVIYAAGTINAGKSGYDPVNGAVLGSETLIEYIRQARKDTSIKAIVLRIDSPGGSVIATDAIWRELMLARSERPDRPIVASMSDLAASGGYYIATPAQTIVAQPSTLTGSIGIVGGKFVTGGVYEKLGVHLESTSIGKHAEIESPVRPYNASEVGKLDEELQAAYDQFVEKVAQSRHSTPEKIDALAQGRVWTGRQAKDNGLVDELGGLDRAVEMAKASAKIADGTSVELVIYPPRKTFYELLSDQLGGANESAAVGRWISANLPAGELAVLRAMSGGPLAMFRRGEPLALMPLTFLR
jgi:protease IV